MYISTVTTLLLVNCINGLPLANHDGARKLSSVDVYLRTLSSGYLEMIKSYLVRRSEISGFKRVTGAERRGRPCLLQRYGRCLRYSHFGLWGRRELESDKFQSLKKAAITNQKRPGIIGKHSSSKLSNVSMLSKTHPIIPRNIVPMLSRRVLSVSRSPFRKFRKGFPMLSRKASVFARSLILSRNAPMLSKRIISKHASKFSKNVPMLSKRNVQLLSKILSFIRNEFNIAKKSSASLQKH